jgi:hypothetical protein
MAVKKYKRNNDIPTTTPTVSDPREEEEGGGGEGEAYIHLPSLENTDTRRHLISLTGKAFERQLLWRLDWWNFMYVFPILLTLAYSRPCLMD